jgi:hypothetical protein
VNGKTCDGYWAVGWVNFSLKIPSYAERCAEAPTHQVISGCVHEHVIVWDSCAECAQACMEQAETGCKRRCLHCRKLHDGDCPVMIQTRDLAATGSSASS